MELLFFSGKGGVGKTNSAVSVALALLAQGKKVAIVDYDGGHSVKNTLQIEAGFAPNVIQTIPIKSAIAPNMAQLVPAQDCELLLCVIEPVAYMSIEESQTAFKKTTEQYLNQSAFAEDKGILPFPDMVHTFFGVPVDMTTLDTFTTLVRVLHLLEQEEKADVVIIDAEPTAGLQRLLLNSKTIVRSITNLSKRGILFLTMISANWPDIGKYLKGDYVKNAAHYGGRLSRAVSLMQNARFFLVTTPEKSPVSQTLAVKKIIEAFGGSISGYVINNIRGEDTEDLYIEEIKSRGLPVVCVKRNALLHQEIDVDSKRQLLQTIGNEIVQMC